VIGAERLRQAARPDLHAAVGDHRQRAGRRRLLRHFRGQIVGRDAGGIDEHVDAHRLASSAPGFRFQVGGFIFGRSA